MLIISGTTDGAGDLPYFATEIFYNNMGLGFIDGRQSQNINTAINNLSSKIDANINNKNLASFNFISSKKPSTITINNFTGTYNKTVTLIATLKNEIGPLAGKKILFYVNDVFVGNGITDVDGVAKFAYKPTSAGILNVLAKFSEDDYYLDSSNVSTLNVSKDLTKITISNFVGFYKKAGILQARIQNSQGDSLAGKIIYFYVNGKYAGKGVTNSQGIAKLTYKPSKIGVLGVLASFN